MAFATIHTKYGLERMAEAEAMGVSINIVAVAVGDGGGNPTTPNADQRMLVREMFRTKPNRVYLDPDNDGKMIIEVIVPASIGGFTIREAASFDDRGGMFTVSNVPDTYKPAGDGTEGSFSDTTLRLQFEPKNASVVTLQVDPNVALVTQAWLKNTITLPYLLKGGTTGQILTKKSNADGDTTWSDPTTANVTVSIIDEVQTLADSQTIVTLQNCTTIGLALYVDGKRLLPNAWTPDLVDKRKLALASSFPGGSKLYGVQNDPAAYVPTPLVQSMNLADVPSPAAARTNLGVDSKVNTDMHAPPGLVAYFATTSPPTGWLKCNGAAVNRVAYASLYSRIGTTFGIGDGFNTFNLPDLRGEFIRAWDDGRGADTGRVMGSSQGHQIAQHQHEISYKFLGATGTAQAILDGSFGAAPYSTTLVGGGETRPRNVSLLACIKY